jgi:hypothetical protein
VVALRVPNLALGTIRDSTKDHIIGAWERVAVVVFREETTIEGVRNLTAVCDDLARQHPEGIFLLTIVAPNAPMPPSVVRSAVAAFLAARAGQLIASAVVYEGAGFRAAAVRSVVTGVSMVSKPPYPHKVFSSVAAAARWFAGMSPIARIWGGDAIVAAVTEMRGRSGAEPVLRP